MEAEGRRKLKIDCLRLKLIAGLFLLSLGFSFAAPVHAADAAPPANPPSAAPVSPPDLDHAISQTIHERKYAWRMPREKIEEPDAGEGIIARFFDKVGAMLRHWARAVLNWLEEWLQKLFRSRHAVSNPSNSSWDWGASVQLLLWLLVAAVAATLGVLLYRVWRGRQRSRAAVAGEAVLPAPDLTDENVGADQLPEDGWTKLARELLARGEFRLAMRAFYLASLAHLAAQNLIRLARFKSNRDYERELRRRGHSFPGLLSVFGDNLSVFERIWYGMHEANAEMVNQFASNVERLKSAG